MRLDQLPFGRTALIASIDWERLSPADGRRLREFGADEGVLVETLHRGAFGFDPLACRIGRMTLALRSSQAAAVLVELTGDAA